MAEVNLEAKLKLARHIRANVDSNEFTDITENLKSLQFEDALNGEERGLVHMRERSHVLTSTTCAQIVYFVTILNDARQIERQLTQPADKQKSRLFQDTTPTNPINIGIIGCGRLGKHIARCLLSYGEVNPENLSLSTRRPETLSEFKAQEVSCSNDNKKVASNSQLLFLCILPSQLQSVAYEICDSISANCIVYSLLSSVPLMRLQKLLNHSSLMRTLFEWRVHTDDSLYDWNVNDSVTACFHKPDQLRMTCPLASNESGEGIVKTGESLADQMLYALVNMCTSLGVNRLQTVGIVNAVMLGHSVRTPATKIIKQWDITRMTGTDIDMFPHFDLSKVEGRPTPITQVFTQGGDVREAFIKQYLHLFNRHLNWRRKTLMQNRKQLIFATD